MPAVTQPSRSSMLNRLSQLLFAIVLLLSVTRTNAQTSATAPQPLTKAEIRTRAHTAATTLLTLYNHDTGLFNTTGWWNSANAITALADTSRLTHDKSLRATLRNTFEQAPRLHPNFLNEFYDDEGWWALAWIDTYELAPHGDPGKRYLHMAETIFADMSGGWDTTCGGGIWWKKDRHYKNAIANELFLDVAAKLALHTHGRQRAAYLDWANREWAWFSQSGMINPENLINDGLDDTCHNNGKTTWTYNQGVVLGGLTSLSKATKTPALLEPANRIATAAISHLADPQGVLHDPCEPDCGEDGVQFKGIFTRNLAQLQAGAPNPSFNGFLTSNANAVWSLARTPRGANDVNARFNTVWSSQAGPVNAGSQTSALDVLNAAASLAK